MKKRARKGTKNCRHRSRGQVLVVEHVLLSAAALVILASVSVMFNNMSTTITQMQAEHGLLSIGEQVALGIIKVYEQVNSSPVQTNVTLILDLPESIVGQSYEAFYELDGDTDKISVVGSNKKVSVEFRKPTGLIGINGTITSSTSRKAMIKYEGTGKTIILGVL